MRQSCVTGGLAILLLQSCVGVAEALTAHEAGSRLAARRHYTGEQRECFARVFASHAYKNQRGGWTAISGKAYIGELWSQCRIQR